MIDTIIAAFGLALGILVAIAGWISARRSELRREQVLAWAEKSINELQTLALLIKPHLLQMNEDEITTRIQNIAINISVLAEQGRLFFKNETSGSFGMNKELAYRGLRPLILDELVIAHQLACEWRNLAVGEREWAFETSVKLRERFVSLAQIEVGRNKTASAYTKKGGDGTTFLMLLADHRDGMNSPRMPIAESRSASLLARLRGL